LEDLGFSLAVEHFDHHAFGSVYVEYRRRGKWIRIIWDGKESVLLAHVSPARLEEVRIASPDLLPLQ
jgi:hypothetical protein